MKIFKTENTIKRYISEQKKKGIQINFVPTMGALHGGHIQLIKKAIGPDSITVCSIFINPKQFNDPADLDRYPITVEDDINKLEMSGCDVLFLPPVSEIYPSDFKSIQYNLGYLDETLEGKFRKNHFQGVCMVMHRLLEILKPDKLFMGQKDYQQCIVIKSLIKMFSFKTEFVTVPTIREESGLAMSSRNVLLTSEEKKLAPNIYEQLKYFKDNIQTKPIAYLKNEFINTLKNKSITTEYIELADAEDLKIKKEFDHKRSVLLFSGYLGKVRLIDNLIIE